MLLTDSDQHAWLQGFAGILEMSIQSDIPADLSGGSKQAAVVTTMAVMPKLQRQGIGSSLLDAAEGWAVCRGVEVIALFVYRDNDAAIRYGHKGFNCIFCLSHAVLWVCMLLFDSDHQSTSPLLGWCIVHVRAHAEVSSVFARCVCVCGDVVEALVDRSLCKGTG